MARYVGTYLMAISGLSSAGVLKTSAGVRLAYAEYNGVSPPIRKNAYAEHTTFTPDKLVLGVTKLIQFRSLWAYT